MARRFARPIHLGIAWLFVLGLLYQVFLAGMGVFDGAAAFATHRDTGYTLTLLPALLALVAAVGRLGKWHVIAPLVMLGQFILQSVLVLQRDSLPAIAALHPVNGFLILLIATAIAVDAWRRRRADDPETVRPQATSGSSA